MNMAHNSVPNTVGTTLYRILARCPAVWKLLGLLLLSTALVLIRDPWFLSLVAVSSLLLWSMLGRRYTSESFSAQGRLVRLLWFAVMLFALGALTAWQSGWMEAVSTVARLIAMVMSAAIVMRTTGLTDMMAVVERALIPFGRVGWVRPARVALAFGMMIRFLPVLQEQWEEIQQAQAARSVKVRLHVLLIPMLARTLRRAEEVAQALDARGMVD